MNDHTHKHTYMIISVASTWLRVWNASARFCRDCSYTYIYTCIHTYIHIYKHTHTYLAARLKCIGKVLP